MDDLKSTMGKGNGRKRKKNSENFKYTALFGKTPTAFCAIWQLKCNKDCSRPPLWGKSLKKAALTCRGWVEVVLSSYRLRIKTSMSSHNVVSIIELRRLFNSSSVSKKPRVKFVP
jgi:hypothetical protein